MNRKGFLNRIGFYLLSILYLNLKGFWSKWFKPTSSESGPFFGNGFRNGWVDQKSGVIWTRLTKTRDLKQNGKAFIHISREDHNQNFKYLADKDKIHKAQIPKGYSLEDMVGSCPGMNGEVTITWHPLDNSKMKKVLKWASVDQNKNHTKQWRLQNLAAGTIYKVTLECRKTGSSKVTDKISGRFTTPPKENESKGIGFCVVTCHSYNWRDSPKGHTIYRSMLKHNPDFYVHTGDVEYYDAPDPWAMTEELMRFRWNRLFALPNQRNFYTKITSYFMKDDHDTLCNDCFPGSSYGSVSFERGIEIFDKEQFPSSDKTYKTVRWGKSLEVWFLEGRNYRSRNDIEDGPEKTVLGKEQKEWLFDTVTNSDATFKVIISPTPILGPDKKGKTDNLANVNFKNEGDNMRKFFSEQKNLYLCNGDRHWQYATHWESMDLWEFGCGAGSDNHPMLWASNDIRPEHEFLRVKGGYLYVQANSEKIYFHHCDVEGKMVYEKVFSAIL